MKTPVLDFLRAYIGNAHPGLNLESLQVGQDIWRLLLLEAEALTGISFHPEGDSIRIGGVRIEYVIGFGTRRVRAVWGEELTRDMGEHLTVAKGDLTA